MKRNDVNYFISLMLLVSIAVTGTTGYIQSQLELRKFVPHRYFAYATLILAAIHVFLNAPKVWRYFRHRFEAKA